MHYYLDHVVVSTPTNIFDSIKDKLPQLFNCVQYQHVKTTEAEWEGIYFMLSNNVYLELIREDQSHFPSKRIGMAFSWLGEEPEDFLPEIKKQIYSDGCKEEEFETDGVKWLQAMIDMQPAELFKPFFLRYLGQKANQRAAYNSNNPDLGKITEVIVEGQSWQSIKDEHINLPLVEEKNQISMQIPVKEDNVKCIFKNGAEDNVFIKIDGVHTKVPINFESEHFFMQQCDCLMIKIFFEN